jgi:hypothetical protein
MSQGISQLFLNQYSIAAIITNGLEIVKDHDRITQIWTSIAFKVNTEL